MIGDISGESPVVAAVLEQVHDGHGRVGESVHKDGLQESLGVMERPANCSNSEMKYLSKVL